MDQPIFIRHVTDIVYKCKVGAVFFTFLYHDQISSNIRHGNIFFEETFKENPISANHKQTLQDTKFAMSLRA